MPRTRAVTVLAFLVLAGCAAPAGDPTAAAGVDLADLVAPERAPAQLDAPTYGYFTTDGANAWAAFQIPVPASALERQADGERVARVAWASALVSANGTIVTRDAPRGTAPTVMLLGYLPLGAGSMGEAWGRIQSVAHPMHAPHIFTTDQLGSPPALRFVVGLDGGDAAPGTRLAFLLRVGTDAVQPGDAFADVVTALATGAQGVPLTPLATGAGVFVAGYDDATGDARNVDVNDSATAPLPNGAVGRVLSVAATAPAAGPQRVIGGVGYFGAAATGSWSWRFADADETHDGNGRFVEGGGRGTPPAVLVLKSTRGTTHLAATFETDVTVAPAALLAFAAWGGDPTAIFGVPVVENGPQPTATLPDPLRLTQPLR